MSYYSYGTYDEVNMSDLIGKTLSKVVKNSDEINFYTECGLHYKMFHSQDCCERVYIDAIDGELWRLVGDVIRDASESTDSGPSSDYGDSVTYSYYRIRTAQEFVHITWRGSSNGYYSERVSLYRMKTPKDEEDDNGDA